MNSRHRAVGLASTQLPRRLQRGMQMAWLVLGMIFVVAALISSHQLASITPTTPTPSHTSSDVTPGHRSR